MTKQNKTSRNSRIPFGFPIVLAQKNMQVKSYKKKDPAQFSVGVGGESFPIPAFWAVQLMRQQDFISNEAFDGVAEDGEMARSSGKWNLRGPFGFRSDVWGLSHLYMA